MLSLYRRQRCHPGLPLPTVLGPGQQPQAIRPQPLQQSLYLLLSGKRRHGLTVQDNGAKTPLAPARYPLTLTIPPDLFVPLGMLPQNRVQVRLIQRHGEPDTGIPGLAVGVQNQ